uniref:Uncharacterized protein n=1 Tax=Picea glauca TaxID=3330 RepID=A0A101LV65_PICGL|nr:hypothetical protein ABT39_MTgene2314 [Picea glauca]
MSTNCSRKCKCLIRMRNSISPRAYKTGGYSLSQTRRGVRYPEGKDRIRPADRFMTGTEMLL